MKRSNDILFSLTGAHYILNLGLIKAHHFFIAEKDIPMIRSIVFHNEGISHKDASLEEVQTALADPQSWVWVSLEHPSQDEINLILRTTFQFHPLAIEDCLSQGYQAPKIDDFSTYLFLIVHSLRSDDQFIDMSIDELNIFLGEKFLVTSYLDGEIPAIQEIWNRLDKDQRLYTNGSDYLCHGVLDVIVDRYMPILDRMDEEIESLEDLVLTKPDPKTLERILALKHAIMELRRIISPQREIMNRLSRDDFPMIDRYSRIYFRDIYDHLVRIQDLSESIRDMVSGAMDIYLNSTSLRLNEIMKALTVVSTIFLPLSFVAGVYGMNFSMNIPGYQWDGAIFIFWGICLAIVGGMLAYFRKKGWF
jgi:magnesium transporter